MSDEHRLDQTWSVAEAKARLSELIEVVHRDGPQTISKRGKGVAVVVSVEEWQRKSERSGSLAEFFAASPLREEPGLTVERAADAARDAAL